MLLRIRIMPHDGPQEERTIHAEHFVLITGRRPYTLGTSVPRDNGPNVGFTLYIEDVTIEEG